MAFNQELGHRVKQHFNIYGDIIEEKKMFGGLAFMFKGKMSVAIIGEKLMVRVVSGKFKNVLKKPYVEEMDFTGKPLKNFIYVNPPGFNSEQDLAKWINLGIEYAEKNNENEN